MYGINVHDNSKPMVEDSSFSDLFNVKESAMFATFMRNYPDSFVSNEEIKNE